MTKSAAPAAPSVRLRSVIEPPGVKTFGELARRALPGHERHRQRDLLPLAVARDARERPAACRRGRRRPLGDAVRAGASVSCCTRHRRARHGRRDGLGRLIGPRHVEVEAPDASARDLGQQQAARRRHGPIGVGARDRVRSREIDRHRAGGGVGPGLTRTGRRVAGQADPHPPGQVQLTPRPGLPGGAVEGRGARLAGRRRDRERPARGVRDVALEAERLRGGRSRIVHDLADDDRAARGRRDDVVGVAEDMLGTGRVADPLDVVAR